MSSGPRGGRLLALPLMTVVLAGCGVSADAVSSAASSEPSTSTSAAPSPAFTPAVGRPVDAAVGALFGDGITKPHGCTATVVDSASGDVAMTAAHCVRGTGAGLMFIPGYDSDTVPSGVWTVVGAHAPAGWLSAQNPDDDVAFLELAPHVQGTLRVPVESVTGAVDVQAGAIDGSQVSVTGYTIGLHDAPLHCAARVYDTGGAPTVECVGFGAGTSGSAWIATVSGRPTAVGPHRWPEPRRL